MGDENTKIKKEKITELVSSFCDEKLNEDYKKLCIKLIAELGEKEDVAFKRGKLEIWASAIIYAIAQTNLLFDKSSQMHIKADDICNYFNTNKSTVSNKARKIREIINMDFNDDEFSKDYILTNKSVVYIDERSGEVVPESLITPEDSYFDDAYELFEKGEIDKAIAILDSIDEDDPEYELAMFYKSLIMAAIGADDDSGEINEFLTDMDDDINFMDLLEEYDIFDENNPQDLLERGIFNYELGDYEDAIEFFEMSYALSSDINTLNFKALALAELGRYEESMQTINEAIEIDSNNSYLFNTRGVIYSQMNKIDEAIASFDKAIEIEDNETSWKLKGDIYHSYEKYDEALKCYDRAIEISPEEIGAFMAKARIYMEMDDLKNAERIFDEAEKIDAESIMFLCEKGNFYFYQERLAEAIQYYDKCLKIDDENSEALLFKAVACGMLNQEKEMEKCLEKIMEVNPLLLMELDEYLRN
jgi:tetratricopeptide (TPR) repeat protein